MHPEHVKQKFLPGVVTGETILAICMTEPHAGTDVANYRTNTVMHNDRAVLNGTKTLISRADEAHCFIVFTRVDGKPGREGIGCVLVDPKHAGLRGHGALSHDGRREPRRDPVPRPARFRSRT